MIDLHFHSTFSDGTDTPEALAALGAANGLTAMALTDHDNTDGCARFAAAAAEHGIASLTGVELSTDFLGYDIHLLGYGFDLYNATLQEYLEKFRAARTQRNKEMVRKLNDLGCTIKYEDIVQKAGDEDVVGRLHIAVAMAESGFVREKKEAFDKYIGTGKRAFVPRFRMTLPEAVQLIRDAKGYPVVAHPQNIGITLKAQRSLYKELKQHGLYGLEAYHSEQNKYMTVHFLAIAKEVGLRVTGGSDYHGAFKPSVKLGVGGGDLRVPDECFTQF